ncbi:MAG: protein kinase [Minicystis sp.]
MRTLSLVGSSTIVVRPSSEDLPLLPVHPDDRAAVFLAAATGLAEAGPTRSDFELLEGGTTVAPRSRPVVARSRILERLVAGGMPVHVGRYTVLRHLDSGSAGDVFEAMIGTQRVAMKVLREVTAHGLARFKREFRGAASVTHRNLVTVHELVAEDDEWFFTMEHVEGSSFLAYVRGASSGEVGPTIQIEAESERSRSRGPSTGEIESEPGTARPSSEPASTPRATTFDEARLRAALRELALGIRALHETGKLHLDLNPNNVKVTAQGRVVILDLGLVHDERGDDERPLRACGTLPYMAPEQVDRDPGPASDWYAFGVMLFEALVGKPPFHEGGTHVVVEAKRLREAPRPEALVPGVPADLADLCAALLARDPRRRPTGLEVIARLAGRAPRDNAPGLDAWGYSVPRFLVGRVRELARLDAAFEAGARAVHVRGPVGSGKSTLVRRFLDRLEQRGRALVLRARCHAHERLPWAGLDALVDALAPLLGRLPEERLAALLPDDLPELARLFPILDALAEPAPQSLPGQDLGERDRRALAALRALVLRLAASERLVLHLDDAEGCDLESLRWLDLLGEAASAGLGAPLLVFGYRSEAGEASPALDALARRRDAGGEPEIGLGLLDRSEAVALALSRLPRDAQAQTSAEAIARESGGDVRLIDELARWVDGSAHKEGRLLASWISLERLYEARLEALSAEARDLLEIVAISAQPLPEEIVLTLAGMERSADLATLRRLEGAQLLHARGLRARRTLRIADERLRRVVLSTVPAERRRCLHLGLALRLRDERPSDPEALAAHFHAGGDRDEARRQTELAAEAAKRAGDFDRAAALCAQALTLQARGRHLDRPLQIQRAEALVGAGRRDEAIGLYLTGAESAPPRSSLDLQRRAAEQLFAGGDAAPGLFLLKPVLAAHGLGYPESPATAGLALAQKLARLRVRGTRFSPRGKRQIPGELRARIDAAWSAGRALAPSDALRAALFLLEALQLALDAGDLGHAVPGLAFAGAFLPHASFAAAPVGALKPGSSM